MQNLLFALFYGHKLSLFVFKFFSTIENEYSNLWLMDENYKFSYAHMIIYDIWECKIKYNVGMDRI